MPLREQLGHERHRGVARLRDLDLKLTLPGLQMPGTEPVAQPGLIVLQAALALRPALITSTTQPAIELLLNRPLNDQPGTEPREVTEHLLRVIDHALPEQLVDVGLYLRRRR